MKQLTLFFVALLAFSTGSQGAEKSEEKPTSLEQDLAEAKAILADLDNRTGANKRIWELGEICNFDHAKGEKVLAALKEMGTIEADTLRAELIMRMAEGDYRYRHSSRNPTEPNEISAEKLAEYAFELLDAR